MKARSLADLVRIAEKTPLENAAAARRIPKCNRPGQMALIILAPHTGACAYETPEETFLIVIIDDDGALREALDSLLQRAGFRQEFCSRRSSCVPRSATRPPAWCSTSGSAGMSGPDLQQHLAANGIDLPIVFITAHTTVTVASAMRCACGCDRLLAKPFDDEELLDAVFRHYALPQQP